MTGRRVRFLAFSPVVACSSFETAAMVVDGGAADARSSADGSPGSRELPDAGAEADAVAPDFTCDGGAKLCEGFERAGQASRRSPLNQVIGAPWQDDFGPGFTSPFSARFVGHDGGVHVPKMLGITIPGSKWVRCRLVFVVDAVGAAEVDVLRFNGGPVGPKVVLTSANNVALRFDNRSDDQSLGSFETGQWARLAFDIDATGPVKTMGRLGEESAVTAPTDAGSLRVTSLAFGVKGALDSGRWVIRIDDVACDW